MLTVSRQNNLPRTRTSLVIALAMTTTLMVAPLAATKRVAPSNKAVIGQSTMPVSADVQSALSPNMAKAKEAYGKLSLQFEANHGQTDERVKFITRAGGATVFLTGTEAVFVLSASAEPSGASMIESKRHLEREEEHKLPPVKRHALWMKIDGANEQAQVEGVNKLPGIVNYFIGADPDKWHANIPTYGQVKYSGIYDGIDLVYYGNSERQLEYDFVVKPGADASQISLQFEGSDAVTVDRSTGDLLIRTPLGEVRQGKPLVYQETNGVMHHVESWYQIRGAARVGFALGPYNRSKPLVIDPVLAYSTFLGGSGLDEGNRIAVDAAGNAYVTGRTTSINFPTANPIDGTNGGAIDAFVTKVNAAGSALVYSTYLGGNLIDIGDGIAVDSAAMLTSLEIPVQGISRWSIRLTAREAER